MFRREFKLFWLSMIIGAGFARGVVAIVGWVLLIRMLVHQEPLFTIGKTLTMSF